MLLKLTLQWIILCRLLKGGMQLRLKTLLYDAGCSSEEFLTRRSWKLVCFTQIPDVVFTHTKRTNAKLYIHIHPTSLVVGGLVPGAIRRFVITEKAPTRALSWLKAATTAFTFKTLC